MLQRCCRGKWIKLIINHETPEYIKAASQIGLHKWNGAYYYSIEICKNIIPNVKTDRNWITVNLHDDQVGCDHAIFFVHDHWNFELYDWLSKYNDLILVCSWKEDLKKMQQFGKSIYLPLSVDVDEVKKYRTKKTKGTAFAGRKERANGFNVPDNIDYLCYMPRETLLKRMARYKKIYAVDRVSLEAQILGCKVISYNGRPAGKVLDNKDAAKILQNKLDEIDIY